MKKNKTFFEEKMHREFKKNIGIFNLCYRWVGSNFSGNKIFWRVEGMKLIEWKYEMVVIDSGKILKSGIVKTGIDGTKKIAYNKALHLCSICGVMLETKINITKGDMVYGKSKN